MNAYCLTLRYMYNIVSVTISAPDDETAVYRAKRAMRIFPRKKLLRYSLEISEGQKTRGVDIKCRTSL